MRAREAQRIMRDRTEVVRYSTADTVFEVLVDGTRVGFVVLGDDGWAAVAARSSPWRFVDRGRSRRHAAVRRLLMSHPSSSFERELTTGRDTPR